MAHRSWSSEASRGTIASCTAHPRIAEEPPTVETRAIHHLCASGRVLRCAPTEPADPRWWRVVLDSVLFTVALLRGYEALHAGALATPGGVIAITAATGGGKSTLADRAHRTQAELDGRRRARARAPRQRGASRLSSAAADDRPGRKCRGAQQRGTPSADDLPDRRRALGRRSSSSGSASAEGADRAGSPRRVEGIVLRGSSARSHRCSTP